MDVTVPASAAAPAAQAAQRTAPSLPSAAADLPGAARAGAAGIFFGEGGGGRFNGAHLALPAETMGWEGRERGYAPVSRPEATWGTGFNFNQGRSQPHCDWGGRCGLRLSDKEDGRG